MAPFERFFFIGMSLGSFFLILIAQFMEYHFELSPCPLCILQRYVFLVIGLFSGLATLCHSCSLIKTVSLSIIGFSSLGGLGLAARQVWLEYLPDEVLPSCTAGLERLIQFYGLPQAIYMSIFKAGDCGRDGFDILGLSLAIWTLIVFLFIFLSTCFLMSQRKSRSVFR